MVSCFFTNDTKEYLVVGTAYVREDVRNTYTLVPLVDSWVNAAA